MASETLSGDADRPTIESNALKPGVGRVTLPGASDRWLSDALFVGTLPPQTLFLSTAQPREPWRSIASHQRPRKVPEKRRGRNAHLVIAVTIRVFIQDPQKT